MRGKHPSTKKLRKQIIKWNFETYCYAVKLLLLSPPQLYPTSLPKKSRVTLIKIPCPRVCVPVWIKIIKFNVEVVFDSPLQNPARVSLILCSASSFLPVFCTFPFELDSRRYLPRMYFSLSSFRATPSDWSRERRRPPPLPPPSQRSGRRRNIYFEYVIHYDAEFYTSRMKLFEAEWVRNIFNVETYVFLMVQRSCRTI